MKRMLVNMVVAFILTTIMIVTGSGKMTVLAEALYGETTHTIGTKGFTASEETPLTGTTGDNASWSFLNGVLTISGSGNLSVVCGLILWGNIL